MSGCSTLILLSIVPVLIGDLDEPIRPAGKSNPPKYVKFDFNGNPELALADFLRTKAGRDFFQGILQNQLKEIGKLGSGEVKDLIEKQRASNPLLRGLIEKFLEDNPGLKGNNPGDLGEALKKYASKIEQNRELIETIFKGIEAKLGKEGASALSDMLKSKLPADSPQVEEKPFGWDGDELSLEERFGNWLEEQLSNEELREWWNDFLRDAPEMQDALSDLIRGFQGKFEGGNWMPKLPEGGLGKWNVDFKPPQLPFGVGDLPKLPSLQMPRLPRLNVPMPRLGRLNLPALPGFGGAPRLPGAPDVSAAGDWWKLVIVIAALGIGWWLLMKVRWTRAAGGSDLATLLAALPSTITTRTQLRQAFDSLALTRIGERAKPWNHLLVARHLAESAPQGVDHERAAGVLARLYELARYTSGDEQLTADECQTIRQSIAVLTQGVA